MFKIRSLVTMGLLALSAMVVSTTAAAQDGATLDRVVANGELRVGMSGNQAPFNMMSRTGSLMGLEVDLANILAAAMQVELNIVTLPFGDLMGALAAGEVLPSRYESYLAILGSMLEDAERLRKY